MKIKKLFEVSAVTRKVIGYNMLICAAMAGAASLVTSIWGPPAGLLAVGTVACLMPLGKVIWP